jgi:hypothetical protein
VCVCVCVCVCVISSTVAVMCKPKVRETHCRSRLFVFVLGGELLGRPMTR